MIGLCTDSSAGIVIISVKGKTMPSVGKEYVIEAIVGVGSAKQNRTFHPLIDCLYSWMLEDDNYRFQVNNTEYDFRCSDKEELRKIFKMRYGLGACSWEYVNDKLAMVKTDDLSTIPDYVVDDFKSGNRGRVKAVEPISWTEYNKAQRADLITNILNIMKTIGVDSPKFVEILEGIKQ